MKNQNSNELRKKGDDVLNEMLDDKEKYSSLNSLSTTDGGKLLIDTLVKDIVSSLEKLASGSAEMTHLQVVSEATAMRERLNLLRAITRAKKGTKLVSDEIKRYVEEALIQ